MPRSSWIVTFSAAANDRPQQCRFVYRWFLKASPRALRAASAPPRSATTTAIAAIFQIRMMVISYQKLTGGVEIILPE